MHDTVVGLDEVGRGSWAGPLVAGAVILEQNIVGLRDSKVLTAAKRCELDNVIRRKAVAFGLGWVMPAEIDVMGMTKSVHLAFVRALDALNQDFTQMIIDGNYNYFPTDLRARAVIKADDKFPAVSAAGVIAKVARDEYMHQAGLMYPGYGFEKHVGYGTPEHRLAIQRLGLCVLHRRSFSPLRNMPTQSFKSSA